MDDLEARLVKQALSIATLGTQGQIAVQIATNGVRAGLAHNAAAICALEAKVAGLEGALRECPARTSMHGCPSRKPTGDTE